MNKPNNNTPRTKRKKSPNTVLVPIPDKKKTLLKIISKYKLHFIIGFSSLVLVFALINILVLNAQQNDEATANQEDITSEEASQDNLYIANKAVEKLNQAKLENADTIAWLEVDGTTIDNQVMQSSDNSYYLRRNEQKESDIFGCYFADMYSSLFDAENLNQNTVIYGHTESEDPDDLKFSTLFNYLDIDFLKDNPYINLTIGEETLIFEIFAVFYSDIGFYYINPAPSNDGFDNFMHEINSRNEFIFPNTILSEADKLITLSGCSYQYDINDYGNHRFVVMGKLVDQQQNYIEVEPNQNPLRPDANI